MSNAHPSNLAFSRSIEPSLFIMWGVSSAAPNAVPTPVTIVTETKRGTIANFIKADALAQFVDGIDEKKNPANANPQSVQAAYLPAGCDTLRITGQITFLPSARRPVMCNDEEFVRFYQAFDAAFVEAGGWHRLAESYVMNLVNARFTWRNQVGAGGVWVTLEASDGKKARFDARSVHPDKSLSAVDHPLAQPFIEGAAAALAGASGSPGYLLRVTAEILLGEGAVVYPSQEFSSGKEKDDRNQDIGKILAHRRLPDGSHQAILHEQKVGNAVRTVDVWYDAKLGPLMPLAAEPFAPMTTRGVFYRQGAKTRGGNGVENFYDILVDLENLTAETLGGASSRSLYFAAVIARGGVFGAKAE